MKHGISDKGIRRIAAAGATWEESQAVLAEWRPKMHELMERLKELEWGSPEHKEVGKELGAIYVHLALIDNPDKRLNPIVRQEYEEVRDTGYFDE